MENSGKITVKGIFILPTIEDIKKLESEESIRKIQTIIPNLKLSPFKSYPIIYQLEAEKILCEILYGNNSQDAYRKFGQRSFENFQNSNIGKVMLSLFGQDPHKLIPNIQNIYNTVTSGLKIETQKLSEKSYSIHFYNDPYELGGTEGVIQGGLNFLHLESTIKTLDCGKRDREYLINWK